MASDLGVKALVEFEAKGQREVLESAGRINSALGAIHGAMQTAFSAVGITTGLQAVIGVLQEASNEVDNWATSFERARINAENDIERIRQRMGSLTGEEERGRIETDLKAKIRSLTSAIGDAEFQEQIEDTWNGRWRDWLTNTIAGFDMDQSEIARMKHERDQLEKALQDLAEADVTPRGGQKTKENEKQKKEIETRSRTLEEQFVEFTYSAKLDQAGTDPLAKMKVIKERADEVAKEIEKIGQELTFFGGQNLSEIQRLELLERGLALKKQEYELQKALNGIADEALAAVQEEPKKAPDVPLLEINADRLTRNGATLGDPAAPNGERLGFGKAPHFYMDQANDVRAKALAEAMLHRAATPKGLDAAAALGPRGDAGAAPVINTEGLYRVSNSKDPAYYQEQANRLLQEIRDEMRINNRVTYDQPGAYED